MVSNRAKHYIFILLGPFIKTYPANSYMIRVENTNAILLCELYSARHPLKGQSYLNKPVAERWTPDTKG